MVYVNPLLYSSYSKMTLYYKNDTKDSLKFHYYMLKRTVHADKYSHDFSGAGVETALQNNEFSQKVTYVQGMGGLATKFRIPNLSKWADLAPVSINKAELIIPVDQTQLNNTVGKNIPPKLNLLAVSEEGKIQNIEYGFGQTFLGGVYNKEKKVYIFNLAKHLQQIANGKLRNSGVENSDFLIVADGFTIGQTPTFSAVPLDFSSGKGVKLNIIYTKQ
ncbi:MAG: DUF4270 domain-containing protein [Bacteroidetes bacterium]|nr:DUF4270 domain-containing protein [Bacteroidota bacterium]